VKSEEALVLRNILGGVEPEIAARAAGMEEARGLEILTEAMKRVREYQLVMCYPFFPCGAVAEARRYRVHVLEILGAMERWDVYEGEVARAILGGGPRVIERVAQVLGAVMSADAGRRFFADEDRADFAADPLTYAKAFAMALFDRLLRALPNYLAAGEIAAYTRDRRKFVVERRKRVLELLERFPSLREPLQYKQIHTITGGVDDLVANLRNL
jgi:hypothetical protein